jgi:hypothetical protein
MPYKTFTLPTHKNLTTYRNSQVLAYSEATPYSGTLSRIPIPAYSGTSLYSGILPRNPTPKLSTRPESDFINKKIDKKQKKI